jgi:hypothetical protein
VSLLKTELIQLLKKSVRKEDNLKANHSMMQEDTGKVAYRTKDRIASYSPSDLITI